MAAEQQHVLVEVSSCDGRDHDTIVAPSERDTFIDDVYNMVTKRDDFTVVKSVYDSKPCLIISHKNLSSHPPFGMTSRCRISVTVDAEYVVHVLMREVERGHLTDNPEEVLYLCNRYSTKSTTHKFCPGIQPSVYEQQREIIRFDLKSVRKTTEPFSRVDSIGCKMWTELGKTSSWDRRKEDAVVCRPCLRLKCDIERQVKRTNAESPAKRVKRQSCYSHARLSYMSPKSQAMRKSSQKIDRRTDRRKLEKFEHMELPLDSEQDDELQRVVSTIEELCSDELEKLFAEGEKHGVGDRIRDVWYSDRRKESTNFKQDQTNNSEWHYGILINILHYNRNW